VNDRRLFYETIASKFDSLMNPYDLERRLSIVFDEMLPRNLAGLRTLDLGCGSGWFSQRALERGARVTSLDISLSLVRTTHRRARTQAVTADALHTPFASGSFDLVVSSETLEHLEKPECGIWEIERLLAPGGIVVLTTPNRHWLWLVTLGTGIGLRPIGGTRTFWASTSFARCCKKQGLWSRLTVVSIHGLFKSPLSSPCRVRWIVVMVSVAGEGGWSIKQCLHESVRPALVGSVAYLFSPKVISHTASGHAGLACGAASIP
jgi:SAM-dependent methyltransferase